MEALNIEIINPKALKLIKGMQDLKLIKINESPASKLMAYLKKTRRNADVAPDDEAIAKIVEAVRTKRHANK